MPKKKDDIATKVPDGTNTPDEPQFISREEFQDELKKQLGEINKNNLSPEEKTNLFKFVNDMGVVLDVVEEDPELKLKIQSGVKNRMNGNNPSSTNNQGQNNGNPQGVPSNQPHQANGQGNAAQVEDPKTAELDGKVTQLTKSQRAKIISDFEIKYGINKMPEKERDEFRAKIGTKMTQWGHKIDEVPLESLHGLMEDALIVADPDRLKEEGRLDGILKARGQDYGSMSSMPSGMAASPEEGGDFSSKQKNFMKDLGVSEEHAKEVVAEHSK